MHAGNELSKSIRLGDIVHGPEVETIDDVLLGAESGHDDDGYRRHVEHSATHFGTGDVRQQEIQEDEIGGLARKSLERLDPIRGHVDLVALAERPTRRAS